MNRYTILGNKVWDTIDCVERARSRDKIKLNRICFILNEASDLIKVNLPSPQLYPYRAGESEWQNCQFRSQNMMYVGSGIY